MASTSLGAAWVSYGGARHRGGRRVLAALAAPDWPRKRGECGRLGCVAVCVTPVEDENLSLPADHVPEVASRLSAERALEESKKWGRDSSSLPKALSLSDLSASEHGSKVRVAYQGAAGAFSEIAALKAYPQCEAVPCEQFEVAFKAVELWLVDKAVLPIENSVDGSIHRNYDLLLYHNLHIVGEVQLPVNHCLLALPGIVKEDLKRVLSHPMSLGQCEKALNELGVIRESVNDTAGAAELIATKGLRDAGAIASARAAEIYGLNILDDNMQDVSKNILRFLVLAREPIIPRTNRAFKTSIVFALEEGPGVLFKALGVFAMRNINLTKIESRPQRNHPLRAVDNSSYGTTKYFDYLFFIDIEASMAEPRAQSALSNLQEFATFLRVLGSYPMDTTL
ncbi:arogenate dehydratase/prephenate dehydratase 2, chloroplastic-like [Curcuma longa]|uniref:arogenate dehydratase/prephenate dehydratase 2, chloroplastic-like n=1 Tax=Curcuma longa TaxID=136217 RepID=UPI003D9F0AF8